MEVLFTAKAILDKLDVIQSRALRICCGAFRTTPIPALLVEMGEWPLRIRRNKLGMHYWAKLNGSSLSHSARCLLNNNWEFADGRKKGHFLSGATTVAERIGIEKEQITHAFWSSVPFWLLPEPNVDLTLLEWKQQGGINSSQVEGHLKEAWGAHIQIFTDGSKEPKNGKAGCGIYVVDPQVQQGLRISNRASVFTTEITAIIWALWWIEQVKPGKVIICSDSAAALIALRRGTSRARNDLVNEVLIGLYKVEKAGCDVGFLWVPGHAGVEGNEVADKIARNALKKTYINVKVLAGRPEMYSIIREGLEREWQEEWENEQRGRLYFSVQPSVKIRTVYTGKERRDSVKLTRLRLGHCGLASCLEVVGKHPDGLCECGRTETVKHIMFECVIYRSEREQLKQELATIGISSVDFKTTFNWGKERQAVERSILAFLRNTNLYRRI